MDPRVDRPDSAPIAQGGFQRRTVQSRARSKRAFVNDEALLSAAFELLDAEGWDAMIFAAVADKAGLTVRPVNDRFTDRGALGAAVWGKYCADELTLVLEQLSDAVVGAGSADEATTVATALQSPSRNLLVAGELLIAARYNPSLFDAILESLTPVLSRATAEGSSPADAAKHLVTFVAGMGLLLSARRTGSQSLDLSRHLEALTGAVTEPEADQDLPEPIENFEDMTIGSDDPGLDALLNAMLAEVAKRGYQGATTARVVATAGVSQGLFYGRYASKLDLFIDAVERRHRQALQTGEDTFTDLKWHHGTAVAEAMVWREYLRPTHRLSQNLALETLRLSWHEPRLRARTESAEAMFIADRTEGVDAGSPKATAAQQHWDLALGHGAALVSQLLPQAHDLPLIGVLRALELRLGS